MARNLTRKLIERHLVHGDTASGSEISLRVDQALLSDVLGVLVMLEFEALGIDRVKIDVAAQYIDHNLVESDHLNADEHLFLRSACQRFGVWYSRAGNGISHPVHMQRFGRPGAVLVGCDSHTPAAGSLAMLAFGAGGIDVALAMAGQPLRMSMPQVWGVRLTGRLPDWVSAKDIILELLRRHGVEGGLGRIIEYHGPGLACLSAMDRHVIANMGAELGATTSLFPSDDATLDFLRYQGREDAWLPLAADPGATYDVEEELDLTALVPLIAKPSSPGNVVPVSEVAGLEITQAYIGSSANPGFRDYAIAASIVKGKHVHDRVSLDINPSSRQVLRSLIDQGHLADLVASGARIHQPGCNGCIGMGQAPARGTNSLRTVPRNFPGRSGTREDSVFLCSPETAAASALTGVITDPRDLEQSYRKIAEPLRAAATTMMVRPPTAEVGRTIRLEKTANIASLPDLGHAEAELDVPVLLSVGDNISTDDIIAAGTRVMPLWSNIERSADFTFEGIDPTYADRAKAMRALGHAHAIVAGFNYGQGSSRENAAINPRFLGLRLVVAKSIARIHRQNLINFGVLPLYFIDLADYDQARRCETLRIGSVSSALEVGRTIFAKSATNDRTFELRHDLSRREIELIVEGGVIPWMKRNGVPEAHRRG